MLNQQNNKVLNVENNQNQYFQNLNKRSKLTNFLILIFLIVTLICQPKLSFILLKKLQKELHFTYLS